VIETASISIEQFKDGKITARRVYSDWLGMMQQLGVVPAQVK
jgi:ketosteroid isomerase-like protein